MKTRNSNFSFPSRHFVFFQVLFFTLTIFPFVSCSRKDRQKQLFVNLYLDWKNIEQGSNRIGLSGPDSTFFEQNPLPFTIMASAEVIDGKSWLIDTVSSKLDPSGTEQDVFELRHCILNKGKHPILDLRLTTKIKCTLSIKNFTVVLVNMPDGSVCPHQDELSYKPLGEVYGYYYIFEPGIYHLNAYIPDSETN